jgi:hypothetical protein
MNDFEKEYELLKAVKRKPFPRLRKFFRGISRIFAYAPVVYHSEDWDYVYLNKLVVFKLERMYDYMLEYNQFESRNEILAEIRLTIAKLKSPDPRSEGYSRSAYYDIANKHERWWW